MRGFCWLHFCIGIWNWHCCSKNMSVIDAYASIFQLCHGSSEGEFLFQSWPSHWFLMSCVYVCYGVCFLLSGSDQAAMFTSGGSTIGICNTTTLWSIPLASISASKWWSMANAKNVLSGCFSHCFKYRKLFATYPAVLQPLHQYCGAYRFGSLAESHPIPLLSLHGREGSSFPDSAHPDDMVNFESVVHIKFGKSDMVIRYQVDGFTHIWLVECFIAQYTFILVSQVRCPHYPTLYSNQAVRITPFWNRPLKISMHGLDSILMDSIIYQNWIHPLMRLMPAFFSLVMVSTLTLNYF